MVVLSAYSVQLCRPNECSAHGLPVATSPLRHRRTRVRSPFRANLCLGRTFGPRWDGLSASGRRNAGRRLPKQAPSRRAALIEGVASLLAGDALNELSGVRDQACALS